MSKVGQMTKKRLLFGPPNILDATKEG